MARKQKSASRVSWSSGDVSGSQIIVGDGNVLTIRKTSGPSQAELSELLSAFASLKEQIAKSAPADKKEDALQKADELQATVMAKRPDPSKMAAIRDWFVRNAPGIAGAVTGLVVNPIVGKLVAAAGDAVVNEFKKKLG